MKKNLGLLALTGVIALASCSQGTQTPTATKQSLTINLSGVSSAPITVTDSKGTSVFSDTVSGSVTKQFDKGTYTVAGGPVTGYNTPANQTVTLAGDPASVTVTYTPTTVTPPPPPPVAGPIGAISLVSIKDDNNNAFPTQREKNSNKVATLFAAQTEENVCVVVKVTDTSGKALPNANVTVSVDSLSDVVSVSACGSTITTQAIVGGQAAPIVTDANGFAKVRLFATYGNYGNATQFLDPAYFQANPIKLVFSAESAGVAAPSPLELKAFFLNMSHLYVSENTDRRGGNNVPGTTNTSPINRIGGSVGTYNNIFAANSTNQAVFTVNADQKQPQTVGIDPQSQFGGIIYYTLTGPDIAKVSFVSPTQAGHPEDYINAAGQYVDVAPNNSVAIAPNSNVTQAQVATAPLNVSLKANYRFSVKYGNTNYDFDDLKDISWNKQYSTGFLAITKSVNNHVLTWAGPAVTLAPTDAITAEPFVATYTISVTNKSTTTPVYNATVADQVPAELGVVVGSISNGGTYDPIKHAITWNYTNTPALQTFEANGTRTFTFQVYARQKPGYKFQPDAAAAGFTVQPVNGINNLPYSDPYPVTDGVQINDTTVAYFPQPNTFANQVVTDYDPTADESTINVVRPIYTISKTLASGQQSSLVQGSSVNYNINFRQRDRITSGAPEDVLYPALFQKYPGEFDGASRVAGQDVPRQNPYGNNVRLADTFQTQLDFTNASPVTVTNSVPNTLTVPNIVASSTYSPASPAPGANQANQAITWQPIPIFNRLDVASATVQLTLSQLLNTNGGNNYINCAYLNATNLNQPVTTSVEYRNTWYPTQGINATWMPERDATAGSTYGIAPTVVPGGSTDLQTGIESCATIQDVKPLAPRLTLTTKGEYTDNNSQIIDANKKDGYSISTFNGNFYYKVDSQNTGGVANPVTLQFDLANTAVVQFPAAGSYKLYRSVDGITFVDTGLTGIRSAAGDRITFSNVTVPAGGFVRAVLAGDPNSAVGNVDMTTTLTYGALQLQVTENTTTNP